MIAVVSYGCPRSGTTFLDRCLRVLSGVFVCRIPDGSSLHPSRSGRGLLTLSGTLFDHPLVLVRIVRRPLDVVDSFLALRKVAPQGARARDTDEQVVRWIERESTNSRAQREPYVTGNPRWERRRFYTVRYERLATDEGQAEFARQVTAPLPGEQGPALRAALATFGGKPAIAGKLQHRIRERVMTRAQETWFGERLAHVAKVEGYQ